MQADDLINRLHECSHLHIGKTFFLACWWIRILFLIELEKEVSYECNYIYMIVCMRT